MITLPENKPKEYDKTPKRFFIWGPSMSGKTYLARQFPNPILLNTDGNAKKVDTPSISIKNFKEFIEAIDLLEKTKHTFETIIIDLVDDIYLYNEILIAEEEKVKSVVELGFGKGYKLAKERWNKIMNRLANLPFNIIFISHSTEKIDGNNTYLIPSLYSGVLNATVGRCDLQIQTNKYGNNYIKIGTSVRDNYKPEDIKNEQIKNILNTITGLFKTENNKF